MDSKRSSTRRLVTALLTAGITIIAALASRPTLDSPSVAAVPQSERPVLRLSIVDAATGKPTPARFGLEVDGKTFYSETLGQHGLRFVSIHESKNQRYVVAYARGTGTLEVALPADARRVRVFAAKGFEWLPVEDKGDVTDGRAEITLELERWADLSKEGWLPADEHVHYDRLEKAGDRDWLTMLAGDGLTHAHFMVLKGGKIPGIWARQYAYGSEGEGSDGERLIRSGEEYRDSAQGHINLLGIKEVIEPISTGGLGTPPVRENYPPLLDVFTKARALGGLGGVAHGGSLGRHPTAIVDTVLGGVDFFEIGNAHLYSPELWYSLMNCGYHLPPAAGTDLPNYPFRDEWQPFLGSMRMYVKTGGRVDFAAWKRAVSQGNVTVTSGPLLSLSINGRGPGETIKLPQGGGEITIKADLSTPIGLRKFEIVQNGDVIESTIVKKRDGPVHRWAVEQRVHVGESSWFAARGEGVPIRALEDSVERKAEWIETDAVAHTAAIRVLVGDEPIRSKNDAQALIKTLRTQQEYYRRNGRYAKGDDRLRVLALFERAVRELERQTE